MTFGVAVIEDADAKEVQLGDELFPFAFIHQVHRENSNEINYSGRYVVELVRFTTTTRRPIPVVKVITRLDKPYELSLALCSKRVISEVAPLIGVNTDEVLIIHKVLNQKRLSAEEATKAREILAKYRGYFDAEDYEYFYQYIQSSECLQSDDGEINEKEVDHDQ